MEIGERIKQRREELGMSQDELAKKCGYASRVSISKIESDSRGLPTDKVELIAKALKVPPTYLMGWSDKDGNEIKDEAAELADSIEKLARKPELKILLDAGEHLTKEDLDLAVAIIKKMAGGR